MRIILYACLLSLLSCKNDKARPSDAKTDTAAKAGTLESRARSAYEKRDYIHAISYFDSLIASDSTHGEFYYKRGFSYDMVNKRPEVPEAIRDYLKSIQLGFRIPEAYYNLGLCYLYANDSIALYYFQKSLQYKPDDRDIKDLAEQCKQRLAKKGH